MFEESSPNPAQDAALLLLDKKALSTEELRAALEKEGFSEPQIDGTVRNMSHFGYLNDETIGTRLLEEALRKKKGWLWLRKRLVAREIPHDIMDKLFEQSQGTAFERACESLQKKLRYKSLSRAQAFRFLLNRGFEVELAHDVIQSQFNETFSLE